MSFTETVSLGQSEGHDMFALSLKDLATNVAFIKRAAGYTVMKRNRLPEAMNAFRVSVVDGVASISFFDYETSVTVRMAATGDDAEFVISVAELVNAVKATGSKSVAKFSVEGSIISISVDGVTVTAPLFIPKDEGDMPALPTVNSSTPALVVSGPDFADMATVTSVAVGNDETLPMLTGIRFESDGVKVCAASTDRFKLAVADISTSALPSEFTALLPGKALAAIGKRAAKDDCVSVTFSDDSQGPGGGMTRLIEIATDDTTVIIRELDCEFPRFRQLFPSEDMVTASFTVDGKVFATRLKALASGATQARLTIADDVVTVAGFDMRQSSEVGAKSTFTADVGDVRTDDGPLTIAFTAPYLAQIFATVPKGEKVTATFTTPARPAVFTWSNHRVLLMPVRIPG